MKPFHPPHGDDCEVCRYTCQRCGRNVQEVRDCPMTGKAHDLFRFDCIVAGAAVLIVIIYVIGRLLGGW